VHSHAPWHETRGCGRETRARDIPSRASSIRADAYGSGVSISRSTAAFSLRASAALRSAARRRRTAAAFRTAAFSLLVFATCLLTTGRFPARALFRDEVFCFADFAISFLSSYSFVNPTSAGLDVADYRSTKTNPFLCHRRTSWRVVCVVKPWNVVA